MEKSKERVEESTRKWEEVNKDIFVNKESWEHRLARYQKVREKFQEIMDKGIRVGRERRMNNANILSL